MLHREGSRVRYAGYDGNRMGDEGLVLSASSDAAHIRWSDGTIEMVSHHDLVPVTEHVEASADLDDALDEMTFEARAVYDEGGAASLLTAMEEAGHTALFDAIGEEAIGFVTARLREEPTVDQALASLDDHEREDVLALAATILLHDAVDPDSEEF